MGEVGAVPLLDDVAGGKLAVGGASGGGGGAGGTRNDGDGGNAASAVSAPRASGAPIDEDCDDRIAGVAGRIAKDRDRC